MSTPIKYDEYKNIYLIDKVAEEDKFDHKDFAEVLGHIIRDNTLEKNNTPFNIGIFGKWGVGKSTVINLFKSILEEWNKDKKSKQYKFIEFKVWKFSADALKKKFIFTIGRELCKVEELDKLNTEVRGKKTTTSNVVLHPDEFLKELKNFGRNINWGWAKLGLAIPSVILFLLFFLEVKFHVNWFQTVSDFFTLIVIYIFGQIPTLFSYIVKAIKETTISIAFDAYDSDEQFEEKFIELIQRDAAIKIIFIDDLDRCSEDKVIETLETIKTYLDVKTCIFVIACDDDVIRTIIKHKRSEMFKGGGGDSLDYLNKFFQYSIRIPPFVHKNMQEYAVSILQSQKNDLLKLPDIYDILTILIHDEVKNPRKAISLINNFASDFEVVMNREIDDASKIKKGEITNRLSTLAVFTVIKTDYSNYYDLLIKDSNLLNYILLAENGDTASFEDYQKEILKEIYFLGEDKQIDFHRHPNTTATRFVNFIRSVSDFIRDVEDFSLFIYLDADKSTYSLSSDRYRGLSTYVKRRNINEIKKMLEDLKSDKEKMDVFDVINNTIKNTTFKPETKSSLLSFFEVAEFIPEGELQRIRVVSKDIMNRMAEVIAVGDTWVKDFNIKGLFCTIQYLDSGTTKSEIIKKLLKSVESTTDSDFALKIIESIFAYQKLIVEKDTIKRFIKILNNRRQGEAINDAPFSMSLDDVCNLILENENNVEVLLKFFSDEVFRELASRIIAIDLGNEMTEDEKNEYGLVTKAFDSIDAACLGIQEYLPRRVDILNELLSAHKYFSTVLMKISSIREDVPSDALPILLTSLVKEVDNVSVELLESILDLIDYLSNRLNKKPTQELETLSESISAKIVDFSDVKNFEISTKYFEVFCNGRFSEKTINAIIEHVLSKAIISQEPKGVPKICEFLLRNLSRLDEKSKEVFFDVFFDDIAREKTFDKVLFPNDEGIKYWQSISEKLIPLVDVSNKLLKKLDIKSGILAESFTKIDLPQKSILLDILCQPFAKYGKEGQEHIVSLLLQYLKSTNIHNVTWGFQRFYALTKDIELDNLSEGLKDALISVLVSFVNNEKYEAIFKTQSFELLFRLRKRILEIGKDNKAVLLSATSDEFGKERNHQLAFRAFSDLFPHFNSDEQIALVGKYLGSEVLNEEYSADIIGKVVSIFSEIPEAVSIEKNVLEADLNEILKEGTEKIGVESTLAVADEVKVVEVEMGPNPKRSEFIEKFTVGISLDANAWTFFSKLFKSMAEKVTFKEKGILAKEDIAKIKTSDEAQGISRNRFTVVYQIVSTASIVGVDVMGMFSNLLSSESLEKQILAADFLSFYLRSAKVSKEDKKSYKMLVENTVKSTENTELRNKLSQIL